MLEIRKEKSVFMVEYEKTQAYYKTHSLCDCCCCRNLYVQIQETAPELAKFLALFGVDITRPDESGSVEMGNYIDYLFVGYTVTGKMESTELFETNIDGLKVTASNGDSPYEWFPHEQTEPCFFLSVYGLQLPWVLDEPFPKNETLLDKIKIFFKKR